MDRKTEVRRLLAMSPEEVIKKAGDHLRVCENLDALHESFARDIADEIKANNAQGTTTTLILPVGPVGQYPILADTVATEDVSLANCRFFFMDENADDERIAVPAEHPLSFKGEAKRQFLDRLPDACGLDPARVVFPDDKNVNALAGMIADAGGIDTCYGGIGLHGHIAFNEPEPGVADSDPRLVKLNDFTVTINCIRAHVGGNLECWPREAYTLGMRQCLGAQRLRLFCRNGIALDWANTILRLALFGEPGDDYPVTHIRGREYLITTDRETLASPKYLI